MHTSPHLSGASPVWTTHVPTLANGTRFHLPGNEHSLRIQEDTRERRQSCLGFKAQPLLPSQGTSERGSCPWETPTLSAWGRRLRFSQGCQPQAVPGLLTHPCGGGGAGSELQSSLWGVGGSRCCSRNWENPRTPGTRRERVLIRAERMGLRQRGRTC